MKWFETLGIKELEEYGKTKGLYLGRMKLNGLDTKTKRLEKENGMLEKWRIVCREIAKVKILG